MLGSLAGCASTRDSYPYRATNDDCLCERFAAKDRVNPVSYFFSATYRVDDAISTRVVVDIVNESQDTLDLSLTYVRVASRNVRYAYNNKFLPVNIPYVLPGGRRTLTLAGNSIVPVQRDDPWLKIAGEELVVTLKGMRLRGQILSSQTVTFVPYNPKLKAQATSTDEI
jgi:hypothetical protein